MSLRGCPCSAGGSCGPARAELAGIGDFFEAIGDGLATGLDIVTDVAIWPIAKLGEGFAALVSIDLEEVAGEVWEATVNVVRRTVRSASFWGPILGALAACVGPHGAITCAPAVAAAASAAAATTAAEAGREVERRLIDEAERRGEEAMTNLDAAARQGANAVLERGKQEVRNRVAGALSEAERLARAEMFRALGANPAQVRDLINEIVSGIISANMRQQAGPVWAAQRLGMGEREIIERLSRPLYNGVGEVIRRAMETGALDFEPLTREGVRNVREGAVNRAARLLPGSEAWASMWQILALVTGGPWNIETQARPVVEGLEDPRGAFPSKRGADLVGSVALWKTSLANTVRGLATALARTHAFDDVRRRIAQHFRTDDAGAVSRIVGAYMTLGRIDLAARGMPRDWRERAAWAMGEAAKRAGDPNRNVYAASRSRSAARESAAGGAVGASRSRVGTVTEAINVAAAAQGVQLPEVQSKWVAYREKQRQDRQKLMIAGAVGGAVVVVGGVILARRKAA